MELFSQYRTLVKEARFPALFERSGAQLMATLFQLEQSQWWPPEKLQLAQARQLQALLDHAREHVPFYRQRFDGIPRFESPEALLEQWSELPLLTRDDIHAAGPGLATTEPLPLHGRQHQIKTSGSTGRPLQALSNELVTHFFRSIACRDILWHRRDFHKKLCVIRPDRKKSQEATERETWGRPLSLIYETGPTAGLHSSAPSTQQLDWLLEQQPAYLLSMPSNFQGLAEEMQRRNVRLEQLEQLISFAETLSPQRRQYLEQYFGAPIKDMFSSVEAGYIALQCPDNTHMHVQSEAILVEVLDDSDQPCKPGEIGRLVLTPLHNFSTPLIRYENGDYVELGDACSCGRGLPVIKQVMGRERNLLTLPDGSRSWPYLAIGEWSRFGPIIQAQVVQKSTTWLEVRLGAERKLVEEEEKALSNYLSKQLTWEFEHRFSYHEALHRGRNRKFEDFISELV